MSKTIWKLPPYEYFEVGAIAGWLDEQSRCGLQLETRFGPLCVFQREDTVYRYRVDIRRSGDDRTDEERIAVYQELGWEFVTDYTNRADIYRTAQADAVELHTDEALLRSLVKKGCRDRLILCVLYLFLTFDLLWDARNIVRSVGSFAAALADLPYALVLLATAAFLCVLMINIAVILVGCLRLRRWNFLQQTIHTPQLARRGIFWWVCRLVLILLFILSMIAALFTSV